MVLCKCALEDCRGRLPGQGTAKDGFCNLQVCFGAQLRPFTRNGVPPKLNLCQCASEQLLPFTWAGCRQK